MRPTALLFCAIAAVALTGCDAFHTQTVPLTAFKCTYAVDCVVTVSVTDTDPCIVSVDKPDIEMKGGRNIYGMTHLIRWELDEPALAAKFRFDKDKGVVLKANGQCDIADCDQFSEKGPRGGRTQFHWRDKNTNTFTYEYAVNIVRKDSGVACTPLDPKIFNN